MRSSQPGKDLLQKESLPTALEGIDTAYYLVHSMGTGEGFEEFDRQAAKNFGDAARAAGVRHIIYLGGLGDESETLSAHLRSRQEVGRILRASGVRVTSWPPGMPRDRNPGSTRLGDETGCPTGT